MIWDFFRKKTIPADDSVLKEKDTCAMAETVNTNLTEILTGISERLRKMEAGQKELGLQLDDITDSLQDGEADVRPLVDALVALSIQIEDFYRFAALDTDSPLFKQAQMMWNGAKTATKAAGFKVIDDSHTPFDFKCHETESCEYEESVPVGYVLRTLKCGYTYKGEVIRRAIVVVNKKEARS